MGELATVELAMGVEKCLEGKMGLDPRPSSRSEPSTERGVIEEPLDRGGELGRDTGRDEQSRLALDYELRQPTHPGCHHGKTGRHRLQDRNRKAFRKGREDEDMRGGKDLRDVVAASGQVNDSRQGETLYLRLDRRSIRSVAYYERTERPLPQLRQATDEAEHILRRLEAADRHDLGWIRSGTSDRTSGDVDPISDHDSPALIAGAGGEPRRSFGLRHTDRCGRQPPNEPLRPAVDDGARPGRRTERPAVNGEDSDRSTRYRSGDSPEDARLRAARMDDVRAYAAHEHDELEEAEEVSPGADRATDVPERHERGSCLRDRRPQRSGSVSRYRNGVAADERRHERRDVRLRTARFGERDEQEDPRRPGHLDRRERYRVPAGSQVAA